MESALASLELARTDFQANVSSLLEIHSAINEKTAFAKSQDKKYISFNIDEAQIISDHILQILTGLLGSYDVINHTSKHLIFQKNILSNQVEQLNAKQAVL